MSSGNPFEYSIEDYIGDYEGPYDPHPKTDSQSQKAQSKKKPEKKLVNDQDRSVISKTVTTVKDTTEDVLEEITGNETLSDKSNKETLSPIDYAVLFSSVYGIGAAVGITTGAAKNITPNRRKKPILYWSMIALGCFGAIKGYKTVSNYKNLKEQLKQQSELEKRIAERLNRRR